jgi:hypothetical protein
VALAAALGTAGVSLTGRRGRVRVVFEKSNAAMKLSGSITLRQINKQDT